MTRRSSHRPGVPADRLEGVLLTSPDTAQTLGCGRTAAYLRELVVLDPSDGDATDGGPTDPADRAHLAACPYCTAELARLRGDWATVHRVAAAPVPVPTALVERTLATVHALQGRPHADHVELAQPGGMLRVRSQAVVLLTRALARDLLAEYRHAGGLPPASARVLAVTGDHNALTVRVALGYGEPVRQVADQLRRRLAAALERQLETAAPDLSVHVADLSYPPIR